MVPDLEPQTTAAAAPSLLPLDHPPALPVEPDLLNPSAEPDGLETQTRSQPPALPELPELPRLPRRMAAEQPGWVHEVDVIVVGSGIAGLTAALECRDLGRILVVTKDVVAAGSTNWAQGGIASVQAEGDTVEQHVHDTLVAGAGLCVEEAVRVLVTEGPDEVSKLIARGAEFDRDLAGELELTREGGHHRNRIAHAGGDATGAEIERALIASVRADPA
ncbi:MAG: L-aspartate oxidase, partial [Propionibacteriaceae bacterium]|nr:L-aspartate oxidase [Propionibacteriaceae bacterium]